MCTAMFAGAIAAAAHVSSCYSPPTPDCGFTCNSENNFQCPPDYTCAMADRVCKSNTAPAGMRCQTDAAPDLEPKDGDVTTPMVTFIPADGATNVPRTDLVTATFSRAMMASTITQASFLVFDGPTQLPGGVAYVDASNTATFNPTNPFHGGHTITVTLTADIKSSTSSPIMQTTWSFTTLDDEPPELTFSDPLDTQAGVPITSPIVMTFSEPVSAPAGSVVVSSGATGIAGTLSASADNLKITFTPTLVLPAASVITVALGSTIVDMAVPANPLAPTQFTFTTQ